MEYKNKYQQLVDSAKKFSNDIVVAHSYVVAISSDYSQLIHATDDVSFTHNYSTAIQDLNNIIAEWDLQSPISVLKDVIDSFVHVIKTYDANIITLEDKLKNIVRLPDRHDKGNVCNTLKNYIDNVGAVHFKDVENETNNVVPSLLNLINTLLSDFSKERADIMSNTEMANQLIERLEEIKGWPDRYKKQEFVSKCESVLFQVLQNPCKSNPQTDRKKLLAVERGMDGFKQMFEKEKEENLKLLDELKNNKSSVWEHDYNDLSKMMNRKSIAHLQYSPSELNDQYHSAMNDKSCFISDMEQNILIPRVRKKFSDRIDKLYYHCVTRSFAENLVHDIRIYKKDTLKTWLKWIGIVAGGVGALILIIYCIQYILIGALIIGVGWFLLKRIFD